MKFHGDECEMNEYEGGICTCCSHCSGTGRGDVLDAAVGAEDICWSCKGTGHA